MGVLVHPGQGRFGGILHVEMVKSLAVLPQVAKTAISCFRTVSLWFTARILLVYMSFFAKSFCPERFS